MEKILTKVPTQIVQEKIVDKTIFKAFDDKEFDNENECLEYEEKITNIESFKKRFNVREVDNYISIFKYKFKEFYHEIYGKVISIPFDKNEFFLKYFKEVFGYDFKNHKIDEIYEGEMILLELFHDGNGYVSDKYYYKNVRNFEVIEIIEEIKNYYINL